MNFGAIKTRVPAIASSHFLSPGQNWRDHQVTTRWSKGGSDLMMTATLSIRTLWIITQLLMSWKFWRFEFNWGIIHGSFKKLLKEGLPNFSKSTCCFRSTLTSTTVFLLLMTLSMVTQVRTCDADEISRKMGNFSWTFQEIAEGGPT